MQDVDDSDEVRRQLAKLGIEPSRRLGQNFLTDTEVAKWIADQLGAGSEDSVVEIGPGLGALSDHLAGSCKRLHLIEKDRRLAKHLTERFAERSGVHVEEGDAVTWDARRLFLAGPTYLIGNLPYSCGTAILRNFTEAPTAVVGAVLMLQKEVADRLMAKPRSKAFGSLTLGVGIDWHVEPLKTIGSEPFWPRPAVDSSIVRFVARDPGELPSMDRALFSKLVRAGFSQRRKQLKKLLPAGPIEWPALAAALEVPETARAEELSIEQWVALTRIFGGLEGEDRGQEGSERFDVVDAEDQVIDQKERAEVHAKGLRHRAVHMFITNKKGGLFLQRRSHLKDTCPRCWSSSAAGHVDAGESYQAAAVREVEEELGLSDIELTEVVKLPPTEENGQEFLTLYSGEAQGKIRTDPREIEVGLFFPIEWVETWIAQRPQDFSGGFRECFTEFLKRR